MLDKFRNKEIEKHYFAKVYNNYKNVSNNKVTSNFSIKSTSPILKEGASQKLTAYLFKDNKKSLVYISDTQKKGYVKIETSFTVLEKNENNNCYL